MPDSVSWDSSTASNTRSPYIPLPPNLGEHHWTHLLHVARQKHQVCSRGQESIPYRAVQTLWTVMSTRRQVCRPNTGVTSLANAPEVLLLLMTATTRPGMRPVAQASMTLWSVVPSCEARTPSFMA